MYTQLAAIGVVLAVAAILLGAGGLLGAAWRREQAEAVEAELRRWQEAYGDLWDEMHRTAVRTQREVPTSSGAHRHRLRFPTGSCIRPVQRPQAPRTEVIGRSS